jgi:hypothetical protein
MPKPRTRRFAIAAVVVATLIAGSAPALASSKGPSPVSLGTPVDLTWNGTPFTITVESVVNHVQETFSPGAGLRDVGVKIKVVDTGKGVIKFDLDNLVAVLDNQGAEYEPDFSILNNCPGFYGGSLVNIGPGAYVSGCISVGIPIHSYVVKVIILGSNSILAEWTVLAPKASVPAPADRTPAAISALASAESDVVSLLHAYAATPAWKARFKEALATQSAALARVQAVEGS